MVASKMANRDPHRSSKVHSTFSCRFLGTARGLSVSKSFVALLGAGDGDGSGGRNDGGGRGGGKWGPLGTARGLSAFNSSVALLGAGDGGRNASSKWNSAALGVGGGRNDGGGCGGGKWGPLGTARGLSAFNSSVALLGAGDGDGGRNAGGAGGSKVGHFGLGIALLATTSVSLSVDGSGRLKDNVGIASMGSRVASFSSMSATVDLCLGVPFGLGNR